MITVALRDACFPAQHSATLADQASHERPLLLQWERIGQGYGAGRTVVFTDMCLSEAAQSPATRKVAWLIEPPSINLASYVYVMEHRNLFDEVLTHQRGFAEQVHGRWYAFGGSRMPLAARTIEPKTHHVCLIASHKAAAPGHRLRHEVASRFRSQIDLYGDGYGPVAHHADVFPRYRYAVVIENEQSSNWLTEKLIDPLLCGTIPLYWGAPIIGSLFDKSAVMPWHDLDRLATLLSRIGPGHYDRVFRWVCENASAARRYLCAEDWITSAYPDLWSNQ